MSQAPVPTTRTLHYVTSSHWDREWYDSFQGFRMRLVGMLDEVLDQLAAHPDFRFDLDGQVLPAYDYLEIRPERAEEFRARVAEGRLRLGPFFVMPDEFLPAGESLVRNLQAGMALARELGGEPSRAGFLCDMFGHTSQMPQVFAQLGMTGALIWRGTHERTHAGVSLWKSPDGSAMPSYRFGWNGYGTLWIDVRDGAKDEEEMARRLLAEIREELVRTPTGPVLLFDSFDHMEIEPRMPAVIARVNSALATEGLRIVFSDLDTYLGELARSAAGGGVPRELQGELRVSGEFHNRPGDAQFVIPGVASSRIHLKQRNAACEDELLLWAEPFQRLALAKGVATAAGPGWPAGFLRTAWRHLLENHPHDSLCGCSIDQVHQDMVYRFDQAQDLAGRIAGHALRALAEASAPRGLPAPGFSIAVFNPVAEDLDEVVELAIPLGDSWPTSFQEFFGYEKKFSFALRDAAGRELDWQLVGQERAMQRPVHRKRLNAQGCWTDTIATVAVRLAVPAGGSTIVTVEPRPEVRRHLGSLATSDRSLDNGILAVAVEADGGVALTDHRTGRTYTRLLTAEHHSDIGDGWYHGQAVNACTATSAGSPVDVRLVADGPELARLRIVQRLRVPAGFDFTAMRPSPRTVELEMAHVVTLRRGANRVEVETTVDNTVRDHRLRLLFPTGIAAPTYLVDTAYDVVEVPVRLPADNGIRRELETETRPHQTWCALGDGEAGLAVVSRGLPEVAVIDRVDRPIALTLLRAFRRAVSSGLEDNPGGQVQGRHVFRLWLVPYAGAAPRSALFRHGQRVLSPVRQVVVRPGDARGPELPRTVPGIAVSGAVATAVTMEGGGHRLRLFNPEDGAGSVQVRGIPASAIATFLDGRAMPDVEVAHEAGGARLTLPPKRIATLAW